ncbi:unnamed protein product, partial [Rotaria sp. Silwood1]
ASPSIVCLLALRRNFMHGLHANNAANNESSA